LLRSERLIQQSTGNARYLRVAWVFFGFKPKTWSSSRSVIFGVGPASGWWFGVRTWLGWAGLVWTGNRTVEDCHEATTHLESVLTKVDAVSFPTSKIFNSQYGADELISF
jgi:hypothetical protein